MGKSMFDEILTEYSNLRKDMQKKLRKEFNQYIKDLFEAVPDLEQVQWRQYTPYFNDGDPCTFRVSGVIFSNYKDEDDTDLEEAADSGDIEFPEGTWFHGDDYYGPDELELKGNKEAKAYMDEFAANINDPNVEDVLQEAFGEHVKVTIRRDGKKVDINVDEYEHD